MTVRRRSAVLVGMAAVVPALALALATMPAASAHQLSSARTGPVSAHTHTWLKADPPLGRPKPEGFKRYYGPPGTKSPWTPLKNKPPAIPGTMLLESDGTVLVHNEPDSKIAATPAWYKLTPDAKGSYVDGTWSTLPNMPGGYAPLYFGSAILPDGRMIVEGGEYQHVKPAWTNMGAIYNPVTNKWAAVAPPRGWTNIGDAASEVLPDGTFMLEHACNTCLTDPEASIDEALLNARTMKWKVIPSIGKEDPNDEEGWTLEPSGQVLTVETWALPQAQLFDPRTKSWTFAGAMAPGGNPVNPFPIVEIGPQNEMPGGNTFVVGGGVAPPSTEYPHKCTTNAPTQTALYHYQAGTVGTWTAGPVIKPIDKMEFAASDGPGATLPDGNVLFDASACVYNLPTHFFVYNAGSNKISQIPDTPNAPKTIGYGTRMLDLPNGQVLYDDGTRDMEVYTAGGAPNALWEPSITSLSSKNLNQGHTYRLSGKQLAGLDQGSAYGDDAQDATNFPIVRITNSATGVVTYARTFNWTSVSVNPGTRSSTRFTVPAGTPVGKSTLVVVANGIASAPASVMVR